MKFLADMGISQSTVNWLRELGYDAIHLREQGLQRLPDKDIFQKAQKEKRVILTFDLDFADLSASVGSDLPSIIIFRLKDARPSFVNQLLSSILQQSKKDLESGAIVSVNDARFRVRRLPIQTAEK